MESYSSAMLKKSAFQDELVNFINTIPVEAVDENILIIQTYFKKRIKELEKYK